MVFWHHYNGFFPLFLKNDCNYILAPCLENENVSPGEPDEQVLHDGEVVVVPKEKDKVMKNNFSSKYLAVSNEIRKNLS